MANHVTDIQKVRGGGRQPFLNHSIVAYKRVIKKKKGFKISEIKMLNELDFFFPHFLINCFLLVTNILWACKSSYNMLY